MTNDKPRFPAGDTEPSQNGTHAARDHDVDRGAQAVGRSKFDLGRGNGYLPSEDIPWGYGENRVTAMARDPDWLYVYWEITDEAIDNARSRLAEAGRDAWCCLRVYDTTNRVFDGDNAVSYFDIAVERTSRDWFVHIGRPRSACHVAIGVKGHGDAFQPIARSGRTDFPRKRPVQESSVEWLSVQDLDPPVEPHPVVSPYQSRYEGPIPEIPVHAPACAPIENPRHVTPHPEAPAERQGTWRNAWTERRSFAWSTRLSHTIGGAFDRGLMPWFAGPWRTEWQGDERAFDWLSPLHTLTWSQISHVDTWEMAPYPGDSAAPGRVVVRFVGESQVVAKHFGQTSIIVGPWEVTIHRMSSGEPERRVLGSWLLHWVQPLSPVKARWDVTVERELTGGFAQGGALLGASESLLWGAGGASERWALGASEQVWLGASEQVWLGASEQLWLGASEQLMSGASELMAGWSLAWLGPSELSAESASALLVRRAREIKGVGARESWLTRASEQIKLGGVESLEQDSAELLASQQPGASEQMLRADWVTLGELIGASERWGASEGFFGASDLPDTLGGASELTPGVTGPAFDALPELPIGEGLLLSGDEWSAIGASDEVAKSSYPESLDDDPSNKERE